MAFAVLVMRLMGLTKARANRKPMHEASTMASTVAKAMAWYELSRNASSVCVVSVSEPYTHTRTDPTATPSTLTAAEANRLLSAAGGVSVRDPDPTPSPPSMPLSMLISEDDHTTVPAGSPVRLSTMSTATPSLNPAAYWPMRNTSSLRSVPVPGFSSVPAYTAAMRWAVDSASDSMFDSV